MGTSTFWTSVPILWGDAVHNDRAVIRRLLLGGEAYDIRSGEMIAAPTLHELPPGNYLTEGHRVMSASY